MDQQINHDKLHDESKTRTHRLSKLSMKSFFNLNVKLYVCCPLYSLMKAYVFVVFLQRKLAGIFFLHTSHSYSKPHLLVTATLTCRYTKQKTN